jgi:hypothetical protein
VGGHVPTDGGHVPTSGEQVPGFAGHVPSSGGSCTPRRFRQYCIRGDSNGFRDASPRHPPLAPEECGRGRRPVPTQKVVQSIGDVISRTAQNGCTTSV